MKFKKLSFSLLLTTLLSFGEGNHIIFALDGSGSMHGVPLQQGKDAMLKTAKIIFENGDKISMMIPIDMCNAELRMHTEFFSDMKRLKEILSTIEVGGGDNIPQAFEYAQKEMAENKYVGHIYMFGDCDGLVQCNTGIEAIANRYKKLGKLTPFTYMQLDGCDGDEIRSWNNTFSKIGQKTGSASTFNYESIREEKIKEIKHSKPYFSNPKFINSNASINNGKSYRNRPWRCVDSDGLFWLTLSKEEQVLDFYIKKLSSNEKNSISVNDYIKKLNNKNICGKKDWRLPDSFELSRLTQLGTGRRANIFPYIKIWPHLSSTGGQYSGFKKGIDLNNGQTYDYKEDRPYASIFVSGEINRDLFVPPTEYLTRYQVQKINVSKVETKPIVKKEEENQSKEEAIPSPKVTPTKSSNKEEGNNTTYSKATGVEKNKIEKEVVYPKITPTKSPDKKESEERSSYCRDTGLDCNKTGK